MTVAPTSHATFAVDRLEISARMRHAPGVLLTLLFPPSLGHAKASARAELVGQALTNELAVLSDAVIRRGSFQLGPVSLQLNWGDRMLVRLSFPRHVEPLTRHVFPLDQAQEAFEFVLSRQGVKAILAVLGSETVGGARADAVKR